MIVLDDFDAVILEEKKGAIFVRKEFVSGVVDNHEQLVGGSIVEEVVKQDVAFDGGRSGSHESGLFIFVVLNEIFGFLEADNVEANFVLSGAFCSICLR